MNAPLLLLGVSGFICGIALMLVLRARPMSPALQLAVSQVLLAVVLANAVHLIARKAGHWFSGPALLAVVLFVACCCLSAMFAVRRLANRSAAGG